MYENACANASFALFAIVGVVSAALFSAELTLCEMDGEKGESLLAPPTSLSSASCKRPAASAT